MADDRCVVTGNPVGTDTWESNNPCRCRSCQKYVALQRVPLTLAELFAQAAEKVGHSDNCTSIHFRTRACDPQDCVREARLLALCARMAEAAVLAAYVEGDCRYPIGEHGPQSRIAAAAARVLEEYDG